jgi:AcrR family transcriptional regulator
MARITRNESQRVQEAIIQAAVEEIAEHGYAGLRIPLVAERIGKTQGAVYGRFVDKQSLALAAVEYIRDQVLAPRVTKVLEPSQEPLTQLEALSQVTAQIAADYPAGQVSIARLATELSHAEGPVAAAVRALFDSFAKLLTSLLDSAHERGDIQLSKEQRQELGYVFLGMQIGYASMGNLFAQKTNYVRLENAMRTVLTGGLRSTASGS